MKSIVLLSISGNITIAKKAENVFLSAVWIDSLLASDLITISTDQNIKSNVYISEIITSDVNARIFNDLLHFADNVVVLGNDSRIECEYMFAIFVLIFIHVQAKLFLMIIDNQLNPYEQFFTTQHTNTARVKISICNVEESLKLSDKEGNDMTEHIVGTHMDDLSQIYNGRVSIKGSAKMKNFLVSNLLPETINEDPQQPNQIIINNMPFDLPNLHQQYWFKTTDQVMD